MKALVALLLATGSIFVGQGFAQPQLPAPAPADETGQEAVTGTVSDRTSKAAIAGATITIEPGDVTVTSSADGTFTTPAIDWSTLPKDPPPPPGTPAGMIPEIGRVTITIEAAGYGKRAFIDVPAYRRGFPIVDALLSTGPLSTNWSCKPRVLRATDPSCIDPASVPTGAAASSQGHIRGPLLPLGSCSGYYSDVTPPTTIRVYWNESHGPNAPPPSFQVEAVDFKTYVKQVLANEIPDDWLLEALQANAVAVRNFGWWHVNNGPADYHPVTGECYDLDSTTNFQAWDPEIIFPRQSEAADSIWSGTRMMRGNIVDASNYKAGCAMPPWGSCAEYDECGEYYLTPTSPSQGGYGNDMSQWGTQDCALDGMQWPGIIRTYYFYTSNPLGEATHVVLLDDFPAATEYQQASNDWHLNVHALNRTGGVRQKYYDYESGTWTGLDVALGGGCSSAPAAAEANSSNLWVFCRVSDTVGQIQAKRWNGSSWGSWTTLNPGGGFQSGPGATEYNSGGTWYINVYALGWDKNVYQNSRNVSTGSWGGWASIGSPSGGCTSAPAAGARTAWELYVFYRGTDGAFWYRMWNGSSWGSWTSIGNTNQWVTSPGATDHVIGTAYIRAYGDGSLGGVWERTNGGSGWTNWGSLDGTCQSAANASNLPVSTYLYVACRWDPEWFGFNSAIYYKWFGIGWSTWISLGRP